VVERELVRKRDNVEDLKGPRHMSYLVSRTEDLGVDKEIGKRKKVENEANWRETKGFICEVCNLGFNDSNS